MTREVRPIIAVLLGGVLLKITLTGTYLQYVKESLFPWLVVSSVALLLLGALGLVDLWRAPERSLAASPAGTPRSVPAAPVESDDLRVVASHPSGDRDDDDGHGHGHGAPRVGWLLILPVLTVFLISPPALGAFTAERQQSVAAQPAPSYTPPPLEGAEPISLKLGDYISRAVWDGDGATLKDHRVTLVGFATPAAGGGWYLNRMILTCCAADAIVLKVLVRDSAVVPSANTWVSVTGTWIPGGDTRSERAIPLISATEVTEVAQPAQPYEN